MITTLKRLKNLSSDSDAFSEKELIVISLILKRESVTIEDLTKDFYRDNYDKSFNGNNIIAGVVRRIAEKCEFYNLTWTVDGTGKGRRGRTVWITQRKKNG
jgi:hypothetical protein